MPVTVVRYTTKPERADENAAFVEHVFAELHTEQPDGLRYMTLRLADGVTFVHVASVETADGRNPLTTTRRLRSLPARDRGTVRTRTRTRSDGGDRRRLVRLPARPRPARPPERSAP